MKKGRRTERPRQCGEMHDEFERSGEDINFGRRGKRTFDPGPVPSAISTGRSFIFYLYLSVTYHSGVSKPHDEAPVFAAQNGHILLHNFLDR